MIYLAFFAPAMAVGSALKRSGLIDDVGTMGLVVTAGAVLGALAAYWTVRNTSFAFLFERPAWLRLSSGRSGRGSAVSSAR